MHAFSITVKDRSLDIKVKDYFHEQRSLGNSRQLQWISYIVPEQQISEIPERNRDNGVLVVCEPDGTVEVSTDHFGTLPLFWAKKKASVFCSNV